MPIEVRQLLIKATVTSSDARPPPRAADGAPLERMREEVLAECKVWLEEKLEHLRER
jgi:hypothetical protein